VEGSFLQSDSSEFFVGDFDPEPIEIVPLLTSRKGLFYSDSRCTGNMSIL
jgi:hypothetical protein